MLCVFLEHLSNGSHIEGDEAQEFCHLDNKVLHLQDQGVQGSSMLCTLSASSACSTPSWADRL
jgi:hypothetical protein